MTTVSPTSRRTDTVLHQDQRDAGRVARSGMLEGQAWELVSLIAAAVLATALVMLGNEGRAAIGLVVLLAAGISQAVLLPSSLAWFGGLATVVGWVLIRQAAGVWVRAELVQCFLELGALCLSLALAVRFRRGWERQQTELRELRSLRQVLVDGEPGTGLLPRDVADLRMAEEVDRARAFGRPLGLLLVEIEPLPGRAVAEADRQAIHQAITRQLGALALVHDIPFRVDTAHLALLMPERNWEKLYADADWLIQALKRATFIDSAEQSRPALDYVELNVGLGTYQGEPAGGIDLMSAATDSLHISRDLADIGRATATAFAMPATPIANTRQPASDEVE